jgi:hypothetical protein
MQLGRPIGKGAAQQQIGPGQSVPVAAPRRRDRSGQLAIAPSLPVEQGKQPARLRPQRAAFHPERREIPVAIKSRHFGAHVDPLSHLGRGRGPLAKRVGG